MMKKVILTALFLFVSFFVSVVALSTTAHAVSVTNGVCTRAPSAPVCQDVNSGSSSNPIHGVVGIVVEIIIGIIGLASVISIIVSGIRLITSNGDTNTVGSARNQIIYALIGLFIAATAQLLISFVIQKFTS